MEINQCVGARQFFTKSFLVDDAADLARSSGEEPGIVQVADGKWAEMESERAQKKGCFSCF